MSRPYTEKPTGITHCQHCDKELSPKQRRNRNTYCSCDCASTAKGTERKTSTCPQCGATFEANRNRTTYCSKECLFESRRTEAKVKPEPLNRTCDVCGKTVQNCFPAKYCSGECRTEGNRRHFREYAAARKQARPSLCKECGKEFVPEYGNKRRVFCSDKCLRKTQKRASKQVRRARIKGCEYELVNARAVYRRDGWKCGICGRHVDKDRAYPDPLSPSLDHIVPLACGGAHKYDNVQLAHLACNVEAGTKGGGIAPSDL
jgi:hypothetical protein